MQSKQLSLLGNTEKYVTDFFEQHISDKYAFHNLQHTQNVVSAVKEVAAFYEDIASEEVLILILSAWFHDTGYDKGPFKHEERSAQYARAFLEQQKVNPSDIDKVCGCIMATKYPQNPANFLEKLVGDADLSHLGKEIYWDRCERIRKEMEEVGEITMEEQEWLDFEIKFMKNHKYHSDAAQKLYEKKKDKHIKQLIKQKAHLNPESLTPEEKETLKKKSQVRDSKPRKKN